MGGEEAEVKRKWSVTGVNAAQVIAAQGEKNLQDAE
jgi:hypothetical protein